MPYVPVVDSSTDPDLVGAELDEICRTVGFFQITGHDIADDVAEPAWRLATTFFDLPLEDKLSVARPTPDYPYGYIAMAGESLSQSMTAADQLTPPDPVDPPGHPASTRRQSMPYFQNANWSAQISCLPTCMGPGETPRYEPVLAGPHLMSKFRKSVTF